jgi:hypothetical protein
MSRPNGIGTAADFRQLAEAAAWAEPERVQLPKSGLGVMVRRPTKYYWALRRSSWPRELREKLDLRANGQKLEFTEQELLFLVREDKRMIEEAFVSPKLSLNPGFDQFDPNWLPEEDAQFILKYLRGQVLADGQDLDEFHGSERKPAGGGGATGQDLRSAAGGSAEPAGGELAHQ